jgi:hypothetical protein
LCDPLSYRKTSKASYYNPDAAAVEPWEIFARQQQNEIDEARQKTLAEIEYWVQRTVAENDYWRQQGLIELEQTLRAGGPVASTSWNARPNLDGY